MDKKFYVIKDRENNNYVALEGCTEGKIARNDKDIAKFHCFDDACVVTNNLNNAYQDKVFVSIPKEFKRSDCVG